MGIGSVTYDGLDGKALAALLGVPEAHVFAEVGSTLDVVHELAGEGAPPGLIVVADRQVAGRGRHGRAWHSPAGAGVWLGYLLHAHSPVDTPVLSLRVGLAVASALGRLGVPAGIKWPNDIMLDDRKLAGILCEARWGPDDGWVAVGVGMNVAPGLPTELAQTAIALSELRADITRVAVLEALLPELQDMSRASTLSTGEMQDFEARDWLRGRRIAEPVAGIGEGVSVYGRLLVRTADGVRDVSAGSVRLL